MEKNIIKWSPEAKIELMEIHSYLKKRSLQGANNVKNAILQTVDKLENPYSSFPYDPFLGEPYRYIVADKYKQYKIIHCKTGRIVDILSIFNTWQEPSKIEKIRK